MLTLRQLDAFYWTVKLGTLSAAAQRLHTTQSAITKRIQEIEQRFDVVLFQRNRGQAVLTSKGHEIFRIAETMLAQRDSIVDRLEGRSVHTGTFRLGITEITALTWLPALIRRIRSNYPELHLQPSIDLAVNLRTQLQDGTLDMIISNSTHLDKPVEAVPLQTLVLPWFANPEHFDTAKRYSTAEIAHLPLIRQGQQSGLNTVYDEWLAPHDPPTNLFTINSLLAMAGLAVAGFGVCCLPEDYFNYLIQSGQLAMMRTDKPAPQSTYYALFRRDVDIRLSQAIAEIAAEVVDFSYSALLPGAIDHDGVLRGSH